MNKNIFKRAFNRILHLLAMYLTVGKFRPYLHRLRGVKIHGDVYIGDQVYIENEYPECVEIGDEAWLGIRSTIIAHFRGPGKIIIGKKVWIGSNCVICASVGRTLTIGDGAVIRVGSVITSDVEPFTFVAGESPKPVAKITAPLSLKSSYDDFMRGLVPLRKGK